MNNRDTVMAGLIILLLWWLRPRPSINTSISFVDESGTTWYLSEFGNNNIWTDRARHWWNSETAEKWTYTYERPWL